jgi:hypothetical protein
MPPFPWKGLFSKTLIFLHLKTQRVRQYSIQQVTQFIVLNKVLDPLASNTYASLTGETVLLPSIETGLFCTKIIFFTL